MICPKCGFEQPENPECMRCGIVISRYKGPVLGGSPVPPPQTGAQMGGYPSPPAAGYPPPRPASAPPPPPPGFGAAPPPPPFGNETVRINTFPPPAPVMNAVGTVYGDPAPALAGGGTVYGGPVPAAAAGGTVFGGTVYDGSPTFSVTRTFRGTFEVGKVLSEAFSVYFKNFIPFAILTAIAMAPLYLANSYAASKGGVANAPMNTPADLAPLMMSLLPVLLGSLLCPFIATAAITYGVFQQMKKVDVSIGECLGQGLATLLPVLGVAIVQSIGVFLGTLLCVIPGILLSLRWAVSVPAAVTERPGVGDALRRSTMLTEGYRGEIFAILFVMGFLNLGSTMALTLALADNQVVFLAVSGVKDILIVGLSATATAVMYYRLRSVKESIDVDEISSVFD